MDIETGKVDFGGQKVKNNSLILSGLKVRYSYDKIELTDLR